jgi:hypothetical protein
MGDIVSPDIIVGPKEYKNSMYTLHGYEPRPKLRLNFLSRVKRVFSRALLQNQKYCSRTIFYIIVGGTDMWINFPVFVIWTAE